MSALEICVIALVLMVYGLSSKVLQKSPISMPMFFVCFGMVLAPQGLGLLDIKHSDKLLHHLGEITLVLILFVDAARINLRTLLQKVDLPARLLLIGMPLSIALGALTGWLLFPQIGVWGAVVLATILAPTDAALGEAVVSNPKVPTRIRQALNVESGLNDGIALPLLFLCIFLAAPAAQSGHTTSYWLGYWGQQVTLGPLVGGVIAWIGAKLLLAAYQREWMAKSVASIATISLIAVIYITAEQAGGNGLMASFVGGMIVGNVARDFCKEMNEFAEQEGQFLLMLVFLLFGSSVLWKSLHNISWQIAVYAVLSLTLIRMVSVWLSTIRESLQTSTRLFLGWFGPRGLASLLFAMLLLEKAKIPHKELIFTTAIVTVFLSIIAHGISAKPGANHYSRSIEKYDKTHGEHRETAEHPTRSYGGRG